MKPICMGLSRRTVDLQNGFVKGTVLKANMLLWLDKYSDIPDIGVKDIMLQAAM